MRIVYVHRKGHNVVVSVQATLSHDLIGESRRRRYLGIVFVEVDTVQVFHCDAASVGRWHFACEQLFRGVRRARLRANDGEVCLGGEGLLTWRRRCGCYCLEIWVNRRKHQGDDYLGNFAETQKNQSANSGSTGDIPLTLDDHDFSKSSDILGGRG